MSESTPEPTPGAIKTDFFISRAGADAALAARLAEIVRAAGRTPFHQSEDFGHADFMRRMEQGAESGACLVCVLSSAYQQSEHCRKEYNTALARDPNNLAERVIVLRVEAVEPTGNLAALAYTDLSALMGEPAAFERAVRVALGFEQKPAELEFWQRYRRADLPPSRNSRAEALHRARGPDRAPR